MQAPGKTGIIHWYLWNNKANKVTLKNNLWNNNPPHTLPHISLIVTLNKSRDKVLDQIIVPNIKSISQISVNISQISGLSNSTAPF